MDNFKATNTKPKVSVGEIIKSNDVTVNFMFEIK